MKGSFCAHSLKNLALEDSCEISGRLRWYRREEIQYNTIQILLSTPHGGFSETSINSTGNQKINK